MRTLTRQEVMAEQAAKHARETVGKLVRGVWIVDCSAADPLSKAELKFHALLRSDQYVVWSDEVNGITRSEPEQ